MLQFDWPWVLALLPLPLLVYLFTSRSKQEDAALLVPFYQDIHDLSQQQHKTASRNYLLLFLMSLLWLCCLLAAARPQWVGESVSLPSSGRDLLLAVDISGSMETADMILDDQQVNRLTVVKKVVGDFVQRRETDRLGLILFGTQAYLQAPLTFDRHTVNTLLDEARLGFAGEKTAIGDAIGLATKRLLKRPENHRILILLTDGANTAGEVEPLKAAELAKQAQVKIYTIGIGANEWVIPGLFGGSFGARRVNPSVDLDENTLITIAEQTGGKYFRARNVEELEEIYAELDVLEPIEQDAESYRPTLALFYWPLAAALLISFLLAAISIWQERSISSDASETSNYDANRPFGAIGNIRKQFLYMPRRLLFLVCTPVIGLLAAYAINELITHEGSITLKRTITLTEPYARVFFGVMGAIFICLFIFCAVCIVNSFGKKRYIVLTDSELIAPKNIWSSKLVSIPLNSISEIQSNSLRGTKIVIIKYFNWKVVFLSSFFENKLKFNNFKDDLKASVNTTGFADNQYRNNAMRAGTT